MRQPLDRTKPDWWKSAVFYQIYPRSFQDTNGDGLGDIPGILRHLDYLEFLGADGIWLSPVYDSPQVDNGYDIADYRAIWPPFGTLSDLETLIREADRRGMIIIMDLVLNHTSDRHVWFQEALKSRDNPFHDWYIWADGTPGSPPSDMRASFGGSAWTWVPSLQQYYFHQFAPEQPDLNWENPAVRRALYDMIRFWAEKGIGGFRLDVIELVGKEPRKGITVNGPRLHDMIRELSQEAFVEKNLVTVGECWNAGLEEARLYSNPDGSELSMIFQFEHILQDQVPGGTKWDLAPLSLPALKRSFERWQHGLFGRGWNSLFLDNHDLPRIVSRWGDEGRYRVESAKMLASMLYGMQGTPFLYQGEELGMTNIRLPMEEYQDVETKDAWRSCLARGFTEEQARKAIQARSRDNARTPMQWSDAPFAGFSTAAPWLPVNPNYREINARAALADPDSVFHYYRRLIALRRQYSVFRNGSFTLLDPDSQQLFAYTRDTDREHLLVVCNFTASAVPFRTPAAFSSAELLLSNYSDQTDTLRPFEARILYSQGDMLHV